MILVDTSIWIDHLRGGGGGALARLLQHGRVLGHPAVRGEIAVGRLSDRTEILGLLANLPQATPATDAEVMTLIQSRKLFGLGIGYIDAHLLGATLLTSGARLWTRDKSLEATASALGCAATAPTRP